MNYDQVAYDLPGVAPNAEKVVVDIDPAELAKYPDSWVKVRADLNDFLPKLHVSGNYGAWLAECKKMNKDNPVIDK